MKLQKVFSSVMLAFLMVSSADWMAFGAEKYRLALIIEPNKTNGLERQDAEIIHNVLVSKLSNAARIEIYARGGQVEAVLKELRWGESANMDPSKTAELGRFAGAQGVLTASVAVMSEKSEESSSYTVGDFLVDVGKRKNRRRDGGRERRERQMEYKGEYALTIQIIDVETTRVAFSETVRKTISRTYSRGGRVEKEEVRAQALSLAAAHMGERIRQWINRGGRSGTPANVVRPRPIPKPRPPK
jgi:curli biogenesis system outer membrane secretion channel CsgG